MNNRKIVDYTVLMEIDVNRLIGNVRHYIEKGWRPWGAPFNFEQYRSQFISQAMVKYETEKNEE